MTLHIISDTLAVNPLDSLKTPRDIHELAESAIALIQSKTGGDVFYIGLVLNHMDRILSTMNELLIVDA